MIRNSASSRRPLNAGFTLIELLIVMTIIGILVTIAEPSYHTATIKAREAALKRDLFIFRDVIDQFHADQRRYPASLSELTGRGYLRSIPNDPFTGSSTTWIEVFAGEGEESGIFDIHSGSDLVGTDGTPYNQW